MDRDIRAFMCMQINILLEAAERCGDAKLRVDLTSTAAHWIGSMDRLIERRRSETVN
jgi:hypothetical protein